MSTSPTNTTNKDKKKSPKKQSGISSSPSAGNSPSDDKNKTPSAKRNDNSPPTGDPKKKSPPKKRSEPKSDDKKTDTSPPSPPPSSLPPSSKSPSSSGSPPSSSKSPSSPNSPPSSSKSPSSPNSPPSNAKMPATSPSISSPDSGSDTPSTVPKQIKRNNGYAVRKWVKNDKGEGFEFRITNTKLYCNQTLANDQPKYYLRVQNIYYIDVPKLKILDTFKTVQNYGTVVGLFTDGTNLMVFTYHDKTQKELNESPINSIMPHIGQVKSKDSNQSPSPDQNQSAGEQSGANQTKNETDSTEDKQNLSQSPNVQSIDKSNYALIVGAKIGIGTSNRDWYRFKGGNKVNNCGITQITTNLFMEETSKKGNFKSMGIFLLLNTRLVMTDPIENKAEQNQTFFQSHSFVWLENGSLDFVILPQPHPYQHKFSPQQLSEDAHKNVREKLELTKQEDIEALKSQDFILFLKQSADYSYQLEVHDQLKNGKRHVSLICPTRGKFDVKPWDIGIRIIKKLYGKPDYKSQFVDIGEANQSPSASPSGKTGETPKSPSGKNEESPKSPSDKPGEPSKSPPDKTGETPKSPSDKIGDTPKSSSGKNDDSPKSPPGKPGEPSKSPPGKTGESPKSPSNASPTDNAKSGPKPDSSGASL